MNPANENYIQIAQVVHGGIQVAKKLFLSHLHLKILRMIE